MSQYRKLGAKYAAELQNFMSEENQFYFPTTQFNFDEKNLSLIEYAFLLLKTEVEQNSFWLKTDDSQIQKSSNEQVFDLQFQNQPQIENKQYQEIKQLQNFEELEKESNTNAKEEQMEPEEEEINLDKLTPKTQPQKFEEYLSQLSELQLQSPFKEEERKVSKCNCKKSKCLKLYCECFRSGETCSKDCVCIGCQNNSENQDKRQRVIQEIIEKDDNAFLEKVKYNGCRCTKNHCSKNYCECYRLGVGCGKYCRCLDCENSGGRKQKKRKAKGKGKGRVKSRF